MSFNYVNITSNSIDFPENTTNKFRVRFKTKIKNDGDDLYCGLVRISYPYSWPLIGFNELAYLEIKFRSGEAKKMILPKSVFNSHEELEMILNSGIQNAVEEVVSKRKKREDPRQAVLKHIEWLRSQGIEPYDDEWPVDEIVEVINNVPIKELDEKEVEEKVIESSTEAGTYTSEELKTLAWLDMRDVETPLVDNILETDIPRTEKTIEAPTALFIPEQHSEIDERYKIDKPPAAGERTLDAEGTSEVFNKDQVFEIHEIIETQRPVTTEKILDAEGSTEVFSKDQVFEFDEHYKPSKLPDNVKIIDSAGTLFIPEQLSEIYEKYKLDSHPIVGDAKIIDAERGTQLFINEQDYEIDEKYKSDAEGREKIDQKVIDAEGSTEVLSKKRTFVIDEKISVSTRKTSKKVVAPEPTVGFDEKYKKNADPKIILPETNLQITEKYKMDIANGKRKFVSEKEPHIRVGKLTKEELLKMFEYLGYEVQTPKAEGPKKPKVDYTNDIKFVYLPSLHRFQLVYDENYIEVIKFSRELGYVTGFGEKVDIKNGDIATYTPDIKAGITHLCIYETSGVTENVIFSGSLESLIQIVTVQGMPGEYIEKFYEKPMMVKVQAKEISEMSFEVKTMFGKFVPFDYGIILLTLLFRNSLSI